MYVDLFACRSVEDIKYPCLLFFIEMGIFIKLGACHFIVRPTGQYDQAILLSPLPSTMITGIHVCLCLALYVGSEDQKTQVPLTLKLSPQPMLSIKSNFTVAF